MTLSTAHGAELQSSAIDPDVALERGYCTVDTDVREQLLGSRFPSWAVGPETSYPALMLPMYRVTGELAGMQIKPATAQLHPRTGKPMKYVSRTGSPNVLDVHPRNRDGVRDWRVPLWITEGVKKGDSLTSRGLCVVTLSGVFNWRSKLGSLGDWEDIPLRDRQIVICFDSDARGNENVLAAMRRLGAWLVSKGAAEVLYLVVPAVVGDVPVKGVDDYFAAGGELAGLELAISRSVPVVSTPSDPSFTDAYLSASVADDQLEGSFLWCPGLGGWQRWDGKRWARCGSETMIDEIRRYVVTQHNQALDEYAADTGSARLKRRLDGWRSALSRTKLAALEFLARGILTADISEFDTHPELLNAANGVVDLITGGLMPHDPDLRMTKVTPVRYVRDAEHPDWKAALQSLPEDIHDWYQLRLGQSITGHGPVDDYLILQVGTGSNGKSLIADAVAGALGDYHAQISHRALLASSDAHPTELMTLKGARVALIEETPEERRLNVTKLKQLVGTASIKARYMRADDQTFAATHSLFLNTNFVPQVDETDWGTWRRLALVRYPYRWRLPSQPLERPEDRPGDPDLRRRMKVSPDGQHEAVLAWMVAGSVRLAREGLPGLPPRVVADTDEWRGESDSLRGYLTERVAQDWDSWVSGRDLLDDFNSWLKAHGQAPWSDKLVFSRLQGVDTLRMQRKVIRPGTPGRSVPNYGGAPVGDSTVRAWIGIRLTGK